MKLLLGVLLRLQIRQPGSLLLLLLGKLLLLLCYQNIFLGGELLQTIGQLQGKHRDDFRQVLEHGHFPERRGVGQQLQQLGIVPRCAVQPQGQLALMILQQSGQTPELFQGVFYLLRGHFVAVRLENSQMLGHLAQRFAGDIENARQNRAAIENRNGPGTRLSINNTRSKTVKDQMKDYRSGKMKSYDEFFFGTPPAIYGAAGFGNDPFVMAQSDFEKSKKEKHNVPNRVWNSIQEILSDPILSFEDGNRFGILTKDIDGDGKPLLIAVEKESLSDNEQVNRVKSAYGLDNPKEWTNNQITEGKQLRIYDKERAIEYLKDKGYKAELTDNYRSGDIVSDIQKIVKSEKEGIDWNRKRRN